MNNSNQPIYVMPEDTERNTGKAAQRMNILAAKLVAEAIRTTLGPMGMDKMLVDSLGDVTITNDGVTILEEMQIEHPSAKMIVEIAKTQENEVGDGTTTAVILAGEFLKQAEILLDQNVHPTVIAKGYRLAAKQALLILETLSQKITPDDANLLIKIATTAMTGKGAESSKEHLSKLVVEAISKVADGKLVDLENIKVEKQDGGDIEDSILVSGIVLDVGKSHSSMPNKIDNAKVALIDCALEVKTTETDAKISITNPSQMQEFIDMEENMLRKIVSKIKESGANAVFCQKGIDDFVQHLLAKERIYACRRVKKSDMEKLARATGATIVSNIKDLKDVEIGKSGRVLEKKIGEDSMTFVEDCQNAKAVTILVRASTTHVVDEIKRAIDDALGDVASVFREQKFVAGAGAVEIELSKQLKSYGESLSGREQLAVEAFAKSFEIIPRTLAENSGLDPLDTLVELKAAHDRNLKWSGINVFNGKIENVIEKGIIEPLKIKTQAISSATDVAVMILRIDDVIIADQGIAKRNSQSPGDSMDM